MNYFYTILLSDAQGHVICSLHQAEMEINRECTDRRDELLCWGTHADRSPPVDNHGLPFTYTMTAVLLLYRIQLLML